METMKLSQIAAHLGTQAPFEADITDVSTDTRTLPEGCLFLALRGKNFDGHDFVEKALAAGAVAAVTEGPVGEAPCLVVPDTGQALLDIAGLYRQQFDIPVCAVTGSVGKTTTKELIACVLSEKFETLKTQANLNNEIGCPKTLLCLTRQHGAAVIEMGMNHFGEISRMSRCTRPTVCVITNIGFSHVEHLGSQEGILKAKLEILEGAAPDAPLVTSADDTFLAPLRGTLGRPVYTFSTQGADADVQARDIKEENGVTTFTIVHDGQEHLAVLPAIGEHNVKNALAAYLVGTLCGMEPQEILCGLARYAPTGMRQNIKEMNGQTVIEDCYNASPDSMRAALGVLGGYPCEGRRIAVLGDMLELGDMSDVLHASVGEMVTAAGIDLAVCYGQAARQIAEHTTTESFCTQDADALTEYLRTHTGEGDVLLFKGSHGMHLEEIIAQLYGRD
ncbi:MAG: UDP-N-acetylmuramoyl-tripeptide--D-alanyl-D-alanine ligase [Oscillospiraceae bacterium]|nr:UDP-N-acetylmuramoyl-tripeptide--D-alanyl-D-alanine ligase [Oscillospiraceae bacterium]